MAELPLIPAPAPNITPAPIVRAQSEAGQHIAEAGNQMTHDATQLYWMNSMARRDEQNALLDNAMGQVRAAHAATMTNALKQDVQAQDLPEFYKNSMNAATAPILKQFPDGATKDVLLGRIKGYVAENAQEVAYHAVTKQIEQASAQATKTLSSYAEMYPYLSPKDQQQTIHDAQSVIDGHMGWTGPEKEAAHANFVADITLHTYEKGIAEDPASAAAELMSPSFGKDHPEFIEKYGPGKVNALLGQADHMLTEPHKQLEIRTQQERDNAVSQIDAAAAAGKPVGGMVSDAVAHGWLSQKEARHWVPGFKEEQAIAPDVMETFKEQVDKNPFEWNSYKIMHELGPTAPARSRVELKAYVDEAQKAAREPLAMAAEKQRNDLANELFKDKIYFNPGQAAAERSHFNNEWRIMVKAAKTPQDLQRGAQAIRDEFKPPAHANPAELQRRPGESEADWYARIGNATR